MVTTLLHALLLSAALPSAGGSDSCTTAETITGQGRFDFGFNLTNGVEVVWGT
jgi:hypothetical protein